MSAYPGPRTAVVIPCFNDEGLVREALASIREQEPVEVVVVDDCSTDPRSIADLERIASEGTTVVHHESNLGVAEARNTAVRKTRAPYVFPLDADDLLVAGALARMADRLDAVRDAAACFGDYVEFGEHQATRRVPRTLDPFLVAHTNKYPISALFRRSALHAVGGWYTVEAGIRAYEDWDLWMGLAERGFKGVHAEGGPTYMRRIHGPRMQLRARPYYRQLYAELRNRHPTLFSELPRHRRESNLGRTRKLLYSFAYARRPRTRVDLWLKYRIDRIRSWLRRS